MMNKVRQIYQKSIIFSNDFLQPAGFDDENDQNNE